jgi:hypothetical protein
MLRTLLTERFNLVTHTEPQQTAVYILELARPDRGLGAGMRTEMADCVAARAKAAKDRLENAAALAADIEAQLAGRPPDPNYRPLPPICSQSYGAHRCSVPRRAILCVFGLKSAFSLCSLRSMPVLHGPLSRPPTVHPVAMRCSKWHPYGR